MQAYGFPSQSETHCDNEHGKNGRGTRQFRLKAWLARPLFFFPPSATVNMGTKVPHENPPFPSASDPQFSVAEIMETKSWAARPVERYILEKEQTHQDGEKERQRVSDVRMQEMLAFSSTPTTASRTFMTSLCICTCLWKVVTLGGTLNITKGLLITLLALRKARVVIVRPRCAYNIRSNQVFHCIFHDFIWQCFE